MQLVAGRVKQKRTTWIGDTLMSEKGRLQLAFIWFMLLIFGISTLPVSALSADQQNVYGLGVHYFDTEVLTCNPNNVGVGVPLSGGDNPQKAFNYFMQKGLTANQAAGIVGNMVIESAGVNPAIQQDGSKNPLPKNGTGFGISQWTFTSRQQPLVDLATKEGQPVNTLPVQLDYVWQEFQGSYASAFKKLQASTTLEDATAIIMNDYEAPRERTQNLINRTQAARNVLASYGSSTSAPGTPEVSPANGCGSNSPGAVTGSVVQTALNLAWDTVGHGYNDADSKPTYLKAMPQYNGSTGQFPYSDCGVFVSTVMIASGADPAYPKRGTTVQIPYLQSHPDKYQEIPNVTNTSQLQPGDILINSAHTYMYVGKQANGYDSVAASLHVNNGGHVPQPSSYYSGFMVFRLIKNSNPTPGG